MSEETPPTQPHRNTPGVYANAPWEIIRAEWEGNPNWTMAALCRRYGVSKRAFQHRIRVQGWVKGSRAIAHQEAINKAVNLRDAAEAKRATRDHLDDFEMIRKKAREHVEALGEVDPNDSLSDVFDRAKVLKITSQTLQITHSNTRRALGIDVGTGEETTPTEEAGAIREELRQMRLATGGHESEGGSEVQSVNADDDEQRSAAPDQAVDAPS